MPELKLRYKNENGETKRVLILTEEFAVGRHSENDLSIADSAVSRQHLKIEKFGEMFVASDLGSSLGTKINGQKLTAPITLKNGDEIVLGESVKLDVILGDEIFVEPERQIFENDSVKEIPEEKIAEDGQVNEPPNVPVKPNDENSIPLKFFIIAPLLGILVLAVVGGIFLFVKRGEKKEIAEGNDFIYTGNRQREKNQNLEIENSNETVETANNSVSVNENPNAKITSNSQTENPANKQPVNQRATNENAGELAKIEINSASFLRRIAQRDPRAALTGQQQEIVRGKIGQFKNSSVLAANLKSARANASAIQNLASQKNLKPQFLTAAALAKLGNSAGDVLSAAQSMANVLDELSRNVGDEFSDDSLLAIAAYEQGAAGQTLEMRNMLQGLTDKFPESSRRIRTIWFLKENGKISDSQFEFALRFLAVGTISQNPRDFGVNAEAVKF